MLIMIVGMVLVALSIYRGRALSNYLKSSSMNVYSTHLSSRLYLQEMVVTEIKQALYCVVGFTGATMIAMGACLTWIF